MWPLRPGGHLAAQFRHQLAHGLRHGQRVGARRRLDADEDGLLVLVLVEGIVVLGAQLDGGDILQAHQGAVAGAHHQLAEILLGADVGIGAQVGDGVGALGLPHPGQVVVGLQHLQHLCGRDLQRGHAPRVEPDAHGEGAVADQAGLGHARHCLQLGLHHAQQVVGDLRGLHGLAVEGHVHERRGITGGGGDDRVLRFRRQHVALAGHLGLDLRHRRVGVVVQLHVHFDGGAALGAARGDVVDAVGLGDGLLQGRGDEALDQFAAGTGIAGAHGDHGILGLRVLAQFQQADGTQANHQDQQADHAGQHRAIHEDVGEFHYSLTWPSSSMELSIFTGMSLRNLL
jgi:hypothetical protein